MKKKNNKRKNYIRSLDKFVSSHLIGSRGQKNHKLIFYLRLYTNLMLAHNNFKHKAYDRMNHQFKTTLHFCNECQFRDERATVKKIVEIINEIMPHVKRLMKKKERYLDSEYAIRTKIRAAQAICILRLLSL